MVSELRQHLKKYSDDDLRLIIAEMYKSMPKGLREENGIDLLLQDPHSVSNAGRIRKNQEQKIGIVDLKNEIDQFVQNAYKSYYYAPNRSITKKERSGLDRGINQDSIKSAITLVINTQVDRETLPSFLIKILVKNLKSADAKEMAIEACEMLKAEIVEKKSAPSKKSMDFRQLRLWA
ncbi:hypothetical protein [Sporolactobacillus pectinivorans]|uniref:hypothetical protein n=1 Tax=Sporolactobacillus pectinivorans TaxID=1591408 RepID=UPI000C25B50D|nr:hypothetical protein [Sporolactobacillus pectinivorans]